GLDAFFVIKKGLVLLEWKYFPTPKILDPRKPDCRISYACELVHHIDKLICGKMKRLKIAATVRTSWLSTR
ncbi:hypothetical protein, partial [Lacticaseibacillus zeae]|uniref:hypothetical protein n=1 Tax=Lacticaseibacillus zeae TaxID=57037 RepID=UPI001F1E5C61